MVSNSTLGIWKYRLKNDFEKLRVITGWMESDFIKPLKD